MTEREIKLNYRQAIEQAKKLEDIASKLEKLSSNKLSNTVGTLKQAWQSDSSPKYYNKVDKVQGDINATAKQVRKIANSIRTTADAVRNSEMKAIEIAKTRSSH